MEISYKRDLGHNYLIIRQEEVQEDYQLEMLAGTRIPGLLECRLYFLDARAVLYYEITSRQSLRLVLERRRMTALELQNLLESLQRTVESCREFLLDVNQLLLNPDYIFLEPDSWEISFCHVPFAQQDIQEELLVLAEYLLERLERKDQRAVSLGYEFYRMAGDTSASLDGVLEKWKEESKETYTSVPELLMENAREEDGELQNSVAGGTSFLRENILEGLVLHSKSPGHPDFRVFGDSFFIGKKKDAVDGCIKARGISRIHGKISREAGEYYLEDLNSTNGTYLNGGRLEVHEKVRIQAGDRIGFADIEYTVGLC